jgi:hypothetical protein
MTDTDTRLADILALLNAIDERLPKRRVRTTVDVPASEPPVITAPAEKPKRVRNLKPSAKALATASAILTEETSDVDEPIPPPVKAVRKPRAAKKVADSNAATSE